MIDTLSLLYNILIQIICFIEFNGKGAFFMSNKKNRSKNVKSKNNGIVSLIIKIAGGIFCLICLVSIISTQATIVEKQKELAELKNREETLTEQNGEYERILNEDDTNSYMLSLAVGSMGYAFPDEIRFYDTSRN